jgi:F0F1-type ATP synthase assembly protein I
MSDRGLQKNRGASSMVSLVWDLGFIFALPLVIFAVVGRILDNRMGTSPLFILIGIIGAAIASSVGVFFKVKKLMVETSEMDNAANKDEEGTHTNLPLV